MQRLINNTRLPDEWKRAVMIMFFKQGSKKDPNNYLGINLLIISLKMTAGIKAFKIKQRNILQN